MELIADILLISGAMAAAFYCFVLSRRLRRFNNLDTGVGGAVAVLSGQVDDMTKTLKSAQKTAGKSSASLDALTTRAEEVARRLELMLASMHDLPVQDSTSAGTPVDKPELKPETPATTDAPPPADPTKNADAPAAKPDAAPDDNEAPENTDDAPVFFSRAKKSPAASMFKSARRESQEEAA